jgi:hypothetical protein
MMIDALEFEKKMCRILGEIGQKILLEMHESHESNKSNTTATTIGDALNALIHDDASSKDPLVADTRQLVHDHMQNILEALAMACKAHAKKSKKSALDKFDLMNIRIVQGYPRECHELCGET